MNFSRPRSLRFLPSLVELFLHHHLRRDAGVIGARQPQRDESAHAMPAHNDVHLRLVEHVAHVQAPGDVRRRQQQREYRPRFAREAESARRRAFL